MTDEKARVATLEKERYELLAKKGADDVYNARRIAAAEAERMVQEIEKEKAKQLRYASRVCVRDSPSLTMGLGLGGGSRVCGGLGVYDKCSLGSWRSPRRLHSEFHTHSSTYRSSFAWAGVGGQGCR